MSTRNFQAEPKHRIAFTKLSTAQIDDKLANAIAAGPSSASPFANSYLGQTLKIITDDGPTLEYAFASDKELSVSENGGATLTAGYGALELKQLRILSHLVPETHRGYHVVVDTNTQLATVFETWFSGYEDSREVQRQVY